MVLPMKVSEIWYSIEASFAETWTSNASTHSINFFVGEDKGSHILYDGRTGEMELSSSSFRFGRANGLNLESSTFVRIGGRDNSYQVFIGNVWKT